jgi:hypothetical protein
LFGFFLAEYLFTRISTHPHNQLDELLPDRWQAAKSATQS